MQSVLGVVLIVLGLVFVAGPWFVGPPGTRGHSLWTTHLTLKVALAGVAGVVAGILLLTDGRG